MDEEDTGCIMTVRKVGIHQSLQLGELKPASVIRVLPIREKWRSELMLEREVQFRSNMRVGNGAKEEEGGWGSGE